MPEAWMVKGAERQQALESIKQKIVDLEGDVSKEHICGTLVLLIMSHLGSKLRREGDLQEVLGSVDYNKAQVPYRLFYAEIIPIVEASSAHREEQNVLLCRVLEFAQSSFTSGFYCKLQRAEIHDPHRIYDGHGPMDEVEMPLPHQVG
jgi:hypothetical protein